MHCIGIKLNGRKWETTTTFYFGGKMKAIHKHQDFLIKLRHSIFKQPLHEKLQSERNICGNLARLYFFIVDCLRAKRVSTPITPLGWCMLVSITAFKVLVIPIKYIIHYRRVTRLAANSFLLPQWCASGCVKKNALLIFIPHRGLKKRRLPQLYCSKLW